MPGRTAAMLAMRDVSVSSASAGSMDVSNDERRGSQKKRRQHVRIEIEAVPDEDAKRQTCFEERLEEVLIRNDAEEDARDDVECEKSSEGLKEQERVGTLLRCSGKEASCGDDEEEVDDKERLEEQVEPGAEESGQHSTVGYSLSLAE
eukprot:2579351-Rhodomonas_salina.3